MAKKSIKERVKSKARASKSKARASKAKAKAVKPRVKAKVKGAAVAAFAVALLVLTGCATSDPASRQNSSKTGDIEPTVRTEIGEGAASNSVSVVLHITIGDGTVASADSSGSSETITATPTNDVKPETTATIPLQ